ncbi:uncharacterized oxidoreductase YjmC-like [Schistocerca cancellata]|uniref:uncharacterized oxidoreductase YjmC-like n=1 Tax=Schistocerca cancellata TaxID=274614 RepID=UPI0021180068|nr:uncharacterized oxidoreductase YjmC-like [Schistocerca cancellata]
MAVVTRRWLSSVASAKSSGKGLVVPVAEVHRFIVDCLKAVGTCTDKACIQADVLVAADYRGHFSHGMNRLEMYVKDIRNGTCMPNAEPCVLNDTPSTAWVDGNNGLGAFVGNFCTHMSIQKAKQTGIGWVTAKCSNHYGLAAFYAQQALQEGMLGMTFTNTSPLMTPTRAKEAALGTNPLSLAAPGTGGDSIIIDMATTAVAVGKIEFQRRKKAPIPSGWALGPDGAPTTDAEVAFKTGLLMPLGGSETHSGYKGYCLGILVEVFSGILSDDMVALMFLLTGIAELPPVAGVVVVDCWCSLIHVKLDILGDTFDTGSADVLSGSPVVLLLVSSAQFLLYLEYLWVWNLVLLLFLD